MTEISKTGHTATWQKMLIFLMHLVLFAMVLALNSSKAVLSIGWISLIGLSVIYRLTDRSLMQTVARGYWVPAILLMAIFVLACIRGDWGRVPRSVVARLTHQNAFFVALRRNLAHATDLA